VPDFCNLWRLTGDIHAEWSRLIAPFGMEKRLQLTRSGRNGDLDMLQIEPLGRPYRAEVVFTPSPLSPSEQYHQVTLWCILTQPLLLSCHIPTMDAFDFNLVTNDEVLAVDQDPLCRQGYRVANREGEWEIWAKDLADGSKAVAMVNLTAEDRVLSVTRDQFGLSGILRDVWRQKDLGVLGDRFSAAVSPHGVVFVRVRPAPDQPAGGPRHEFVSYPGKLDEAALSAQRGWHELDAEIAFVGGAATATL
jgi:alpha-galactosidase